MNVNDSTMGSADRTRAEPYDRADSMTPTVLVIGPGPDQVGGMASVVAQIAEMDFHGRYRVVLFPFTASDDPTESVRSRVVRHIRHTGALGAAIRRTGASIVHFHTCSGFSFYRAGLDMLMAKGLACRVILHIHGATFDRFYDAEPAWRRGVVGWLLTRADRVVTLSDGWHDQLRRMAPRSRLVVVENAVASPSHTVAPSDNGPGRFLLLARMDRWKGIDDLLRACAILESQGVKFEMVLAGPPGTAGDATELGDRIRALNLGTQVRYVGPVLGAAKTELLAWANAYVQPSHHEGMPIALLEALSHGLPVVATRVGAVPEVIEDRQQGLLVPPHRPDLLADAMQDLAQNTRRRAAFAGSARRLAQSRFSIDRLRDDLITLYDAVGVPRRTTRASTVTPGLVHAG